MAGANFKHKKGKGWSNGGTCGNTSENFLLLQGRKDKSKKPKGPNPDFIHKHTMVVSQVNTCKP
jgi:hypothetical protein